MLGIDGETRQVAGTSCGDEAGAQRLSQRTGKTVWRQVRSGLVVIAAVSAVAACSSAPPEKVKFSEKKYGVKASPRMVAAGKPVPKGGGRYVVGKKYKIAGKWYYPKEDTSYKKTGLASWYGPTFHGRKTANGEVFDRNGLTAAHTTMPLPSYARVTNVANGRSMIVRVNDRGPFHGNRVIDLSERVATLLGTKSAGVGKVKVEYVGKAPLHGQDEAYLMASLQGADSVVPGGTMPGTLLAQADPQTLQPAPRVVFGKVPAPGPRPYLSAPTTVAAYRPQSPAPLSVAFDPAIAFEAGRPTIEVASNNRFEPSPSAYAPQQAPAPGTLGILPASALQGGGAVSSFRANERVSGAHALLATATFGPSLSMRELAANIPSDE
ncbi:septal ring lytic transglycosylase RlpA family protein [Roseibium aggregatum]|uniref:Endolytic peptidoglycan transglycosylase RlpA n=1 Tax=Roseibium aggregatum TaxID=187304 RepID=A0A939EC58_9HYPH|nr:septal ring lytic transglycosylase RlpA family protein [Roseibium aggregatum]MBN9670621.1 septal ring lytic transglycosylase RlpA family protein [Roseibium aggregatum]